MAIRVARPGLHPSNALLARKLAELGVLAERTGTPLLCEAAAAAALPISDAVDDEPDALVYAQAEAVQLPMSLAEPPPRTWASRRRCAFIDGFSLHADTVDAADRSALERLVRYVLRPARSPSYRSIRKRRPESCASPAPPTLGSRSYRT